MTKQHEQSNFSILFVDDEEYSAKYFKKIFSQYYNVIATTSPIEALEILEEKSDEIAVIITDQRMPKKTGVELLNKAKENHPDIIRILTTAFINIDENIEAINNSNIFGYITKPWNIDSVKYMLDKAVTSFNTNLALKSLSGSIAHEIRNPLNTVNLSLNQIKDYLVEAQNMCQANCFTSQISDMINIAFSSVRRANDLIDKTLKSAQGKEIDKDSFKYLKAQELIKKVIQEYGYSHKEEKDLIKLNYEKNKDFVFKGDETLFIFVLFNLLKNALYYQNYKKNFQININTLEDDHYNIITIKDNGPGISKENQRMIFESFVTSNKQNGTGLGLPFCRRITESFDGSIECNSIEGEFCEFIIKLPKLSKEELKKAKKANSIEENKSILQKKITLQLFCEDKKTNKKITKLLNQTFSNIAITNIIEISQIENDYNLAIICSDQEIKRPDNILIPIIYLNKDGNNISGEFEETINTNNDLFEQNLIRTICKWNLINFIPNIEDPSTKQNILIADDDKTNLMILKKILTNNGYQVEATENGKETYEKYLEKKPDLIITDINMPELDGIQICNKIRQDEKQNKTSTQTPIICYCGDLAKEKVYQYLKHGFSDYFLKGNDTKYLIDLVKFYTQ